MRPHPTSSKRADRVVGAMLGAAIGDALGSAYEMLPNAKIERHLGKPFVTDYEPALRGSLLYPRGPGQPTDDTAMALSVASSLTCGEPLTAELFATRFLADLEPQSGRFSEMFWNGGPGGATVQALRRLRLGASPATNGHIDDGGNGAAMRVHPVGCLRDRKTVLRVSAMQARITHGHPAAIAAAQAVAVLVHEAIAGMPASSDLPRGIDDPEFAKCWAEAHRDLVPDEPLPPHLRNVSMSGWATVAAAHAISLIYQTRPERAIGAAVASGGDTDTIGSIVGAIVGARFGQSSLPSCWVAGLPQSIAADCKALGDALASASARLTTTQVVSCRKCGCTHLLRIQYGFPTPEASEAAERGEIALGGCCIDVDSPDWQCNSCGGRFLTEQAITL